MDRNALRRRDGPGELSADPALAVLAGTIRRLYFICFRHEKLRREGVASTWGDEYIARYDGGTTDSGDYKPVWPKIARLCVANQFDPAPFIQAQFDHSRDQIVLPNMLLGEGAVTRYRVQAQVQELEVQTALLIQRKLIDAEARWQVSASEGVLSLNEAYLKVLLDTSVGLSGLFRYCVATRAGATSVAARFFDTAVHQYLFCRNAYDRHWREWIVPPLREAARQLAGEMTGA